MRKLLSVILILCLTVSLLAGCESGLHEQDPQKEDNTQQPTAPEAEPTEAGKETSQRQAYYDYLQNSLIPQVGLANLVSGEWKHCSAPKGGVENNATHLLEIGCGGLLSAVVRDFDLDGDEDMVTFTMTALPHNQTWIPIYGEGYKTPAHVIAFDYYTLEDGEIVLKDTYPCGILLDGASWGCISITMEQLEDGIYIRSSSSATDYTTYGASPTTIFHIADDKFVLDYISGITYGQGSMDQNPNVVMGTTNINPYEYTFDTLSANYDEVDPNGDTENRWIYFADFPEPDDYMASYTGTDYTGLRIILEKGLDAFPHEPLPQGGKKPPNPILEEAKVVAQKIGDYVSEQSGCVYTDISASIHTGATEAWVTFETEEYTRLSISYDGVTQKVIRVNLSSNDFPVPQEWQDMKDALVRYPGFGFTEEEIAPFLGTIKNFSKYAPGLSVTGATIQALQITDTSLRITFD